MEQMKEFHSKFAAPGSSLASSRPKPFDMFAGGRTDDKVAMRGPSEDLRGLVAVNSERNRDLIFDGDIGPTSPHLNFMDIEVKGVTVIAINMVKGGSAVATSDIVLKPVQLIGFTSGAEVDDKLK